MKDASGTGDDCLQLVWLVEIEPSRETETVTERPGDEASSGGCAHQGEARQGEANRTGSRALTDHDVNLEVLHGWIEDFLNRPRKAMDFVDEEHVTLIKLGQNRSQIPGSFKGGPRCHQEVRVHFDGDNCCHRCLS